MGLFFDFADTVSNSLVMPVTPVSTNFLRHKPDLSVGVAGAGILSLFHEHSNNFANLTLYLTGEAPAFYIPGCLQIP